MSDWQPLETAPKDREVLMFDMSDGSVSHIWIAEWDWNLNKWVAEDTDDLMETPILWMPLPKKPSGYDQAS
jgi:hypothetical protein